MANKLSIIIPCYNCQKTLTEAVESCYYQGLNKPFEIIMVNDCSTDKTSEVMTTLAGKYPEIKLFYHEKNLGGGPTRNTAVEKSTGEIIFCLDSDDILPPAILPKMLKTLEEKGCDGVVFASSYSFQRKIERSQNNNFNLRSGPMNLEDFFKGKNWGVGANFLYTKVAYLKTGGYPTNHNFDTQGFGLRFLSAGLKAYSCPETFFYQRQFTANYSYYERAYNAGEFSLGYYLMLLDLLHIFSYHIRHLILSFNIFNQSTSNNNLFSTLELEYKRDPGSFFLPNYEKLLIPGGRNYYLDSLNGYKDRTDELIEILNQPDDFQGKKLANLAVYLKNFATDYNVYYNVFLSLVKLQGLDSRPDSIQRLLNSFKLIKKNKGLKRPNLLKRILLKLIKTIKKVYDNV